MNPSDCRICRAALAPSEPHFVVEIHEETMVDGAATVHDAWTAMHLCRTCADAADFDRLASPPPRVPDDADARAVELADAYAAALGEPESVLHPSESSWPHVDVYLYRPGRLAPGWISVTAGRALVPLEDGRRVEIVQHLAPQEDFEGVGEAAEVLRRVAMRPPALDPRWRFEPAPAGVFDALSEALSGTTFLQAIFRRG